MTEHQIDHLTRSLAQAMDRRTPVRGLLALGGVALGITAAGSVDDAEAGGKCKPSCGGCQQCKKGKCHKTNSGKKQCKKGKCKPKDNGTACSTGTCQAGVCQAVPPPPPGCGTDGVTCTGNADCCEGLSCKGGTCQDSSCIEDSVALQTIIFASSPGDAMTLCAGTWNLESTAHIDINLTLRGAGAAKTILDGGNAVRVLNIAAGATVTLQDLTITKGNSVNHNGGGIRNEGTLSLLGVSVMHNYAFDQGGGIDNNGTLTLQTGSRVTGNTGVYGGGIYNGGGTSNAGTMTLKEGSSVTGNTATDQGGGIYNNANGTLTLQTGSRVTGNTAANDGGGIYNDQGTVTLDSGAVICSNLPLGKQCFGTISGTCPAPNQTCPS